MRLHGILLLLTLSCKKCALAVLFISAEFSDLYSGRELELHSIAAHVTNRRPSVITNSRGESVDSILNGLWSTSVEP